MAERLKLTKFFLLFLSCIKFERFDALNLAEFVEFWRIYAYTYFERSNCKTDSKQF